MSLYLLDTGVLMRSLRLSDPQHTAIRDALAVLSDFGHTFGYLPQNAVEAWAVMTRPATARQGWGMTPAQADNFLTRCHVAYSLIPDDPNAFARWRNLVLSLGVSGAETHDARIVAAMLEAGMTHVLTLNGEDFARYAPMGIVATTPRRILDALPGNAPSSQT